MVNKRHHRTEVLKQAMPRHGFLCPVAGAQAEWEKIDKSLAQRRGIFPTDQILSNAYVCTPLLPKEDMHYRDAFGRVIQD